MLSYVSNKKHLHMIKTQPNLAPLQKKNHLKMDSLIISNVAKVFGECTSKEYMPQMGKNFRVLKNVF